MYPRRIKRLVIILLVSGIMLYVTYIHASRSHMSRPRGTGYSNNLVDTQGCQIPNLDPFDISIHHLVSPGIPIVCDDTPPLTYLEKDVLRINRTLLKLYETELDSCLFEEIYRGSSSDNDFTYVNETWFTSDVIVKGEFLRVVCYDKHGGTISTDFHARIIPKKAPFVRKKNTKSSTKLNVLLVGMDSVSRLNYVRQMPKTRAYLNEQMQAKELLGFNKLADNTFVNLVPMFAGKFLHQLEYDETQIGMPFDNAPYMWSNFSSEGYRTLYAEDAPYIAIFNYAKGGFLTPPAEYYLRSLSLAMEEHTNIWNHDRNCIGNQLETKFVLDYLQKFIQKYKQENHFAFTFLTRLTHDDIQRASTADDVYYNFFKDLHQSGDLHNTVLIFFSDHGIRFGSLRQKYIGKLEERLPLMTVAFPPWFYTKYPDIYRNLVTNVNRLTSFFDIYETLVDILEFKGSVDQHSRSEHGISLFREIPATRTCDSAGIESHWCSCNFGEPVDIKQPHIVAGAREILNVINDKLRESPSCATLTLAQVTDAIEMKIHENIDKHGKNAKAFVDYMGFDENVHTYMLTVEAKEGGGRFEATVQYNSDYDAFHVLGDISRVNRYGDQSYCVDLHSLKRYCFCD